MSSNNSDIIAPGVQFVQIQTSQRID